MKVLIIGGGLIGLTAAYFLREQGHAVMVIDRQAGPALETSFANGALITPSMSEPWNVPGCWRTLLGSLGRSDSALQLRWRALPGLVGWGARFLRNSRPELYERSALNNLRLAMYSLEAMHALRQETQIEYGRSASGTLRVFRDRALLDQASAAASRRVSEGLSFQELSPDEVVAREPALGPIAGQLAGAIHYEPDETGDAYEFCVALTAHLRECGVEFRFGIEVSSLEVHAREVLAACTRTESLSADHYVVAAGSYSPDLLQRVGIALPVRPAKGYSVTFDRSSDQGTLRIPVLDDDFHAAVVPLSGAIRVAGTAEFAGFDLTLPAPRIRNLLRLLQHVLPEVRFDPSKMRPWCGLRPMSADGVPIIGATPVRNLWVSTGHGHLGWTLAAGSARLLADLMTGRPPAFDPAPYALARFT